MSILEEWDRDTVRTDVYSNASGHACRCVHIPSGKVAVSGTHASMTGAVREAQEMLERALTE